MSLNEAEAKHWYVMRDLTRHNAHRPAHVMLKELGIRYFTPMTWRANLRGGRRIRERVPFIQDLVFVYDNRSTLDPIVEQVSTFQYRYLRGTYREPMTVRESDMEQFILAVGSSEEPRYYSPEEAVWTAARVTCSVHVAAECAVCSLNCPSFWQRV